MKAAILSIILLFAVLSPQTASATESVNMDGAWWQTLSETTKVYVVEGMIEAYESGWTEGQAEARGRTQRLLHSSFVKQSLSANVYKKFSTLMLSKPTRFSKTFGTYQHEIDDFYANYPNAIQLSVGSLLGCLNDNPVITCDELGKL